MKAFDWWFASRSPDSRSVKYIAALVRRADYLAGRISGSRTIDLSYDKAELAALRWAVDQLKDGSR